MVVCCMVGCLLSNNASESRKFQRCVCVLCKVCVCVWDRERQTETERRIWKKETLGKDCIWGWRRKWQSTPVFLPEKFHGQGEPGGLQSMGSQRVGQDWVTEHACRHMRLEGRIVVFSQSIVPVSWKLSLATFFSIVLLCSVALPPLPTANCQRGLLTQRASRGRSHERWSLELSWPSSLAPLEGLSWEREEESEL